jgi:chemotaxis protein CheD
MDTVCGDEPVVNVGMGRIEVVVSPTLVRSVLGSCVGVVLYDERLELAAFAHVVLPKSDARSGPPGKFADTAITWMVNALKGRGADVHRLRAKIVGGANMFLATGPFQIGKSNADAVKQHLADEHVVVAAEHLGGKLGRRVTFDPATSNLSIECVGAETFSI